jgi:hypothetical protein
MQVSIGEYNLDSLGVQNTNGTRVAYVPLGRPRYGWEDSIKMVQWEDVVNTIHFQ